MHITEEEFKLLKTRDPKIFDKLFKLYINDIYSFINTKTRYDENMTNEILSDTLYSAYKSLDRIKRNKNLKNWLISIANRRYIDYIRKMQTDKKYKDIIKNQPNNKAYSEDIVEKIIDDEKKIIIRNAISSLRKNYQEVLKMKYIQLQSLKDIAKTLGKSEKAVDCLIYKGRKALKTEMEKISIDFF